MAQYKDTIEERNKRGQARYHYSVWLYRRFCDFDSLFIKSDNKLNLEDFFVELRADHNDVKEDHMGDSSAVESEKPFGHLIWDLLVQEHFLLLAGKPGSGKSTIVREILLELCSPTHISNLRKKLTGKLGIVPIPLILDDFRDDLNSAITCDDLLNIWWKKAERQAEKDQSSLDIPRLKDSFDPEKEAYPTILLFDGIDELGSQTLRSQVFKIACEAYEKGFRVLITGRPEGFNGLQKDAVNSFSWPDKLYYILPLVWEQIKQFIGKWYFQHRKWIQDDKETGVKSFLDALKGGGRNNIDGKPARNHLLSLSRRPIFLTLMAYVHYRHNRMPTGRAKLYEEIITEYLVRQKNRQHASDKIRDESTLRRLETIRHKSETDLRLVLGYIAYRAQINRSEIKNKKNSGKIWNEENLTEIIEKLISSREHGLFTDLKTEDGKYVLMFFINPAGLLIRGDNEDIQFAHLTLQEYLCAEFIASRPKEEYIRNELFQRFKFSSGWDEVAIMVLMMISKRQRNEGHFEILTWLDLTDMHQAELFLEAYTGGELPFPSVDRIEWLPVAVTCSIFHPDEKFESRYLYYVRDIIGQEGISLITRILKENTAEKQWEILLQRVNDKKNKHLSESLLSWQVRNNWLETKRHLPEQQEFREIEAIFYALLHIIARSDWGDEKSRDNKDKLIPLAILQPGTDLEQAVEIWVRNNEKSTSIEESTPFYMRPVDPGNPFRLPTPTRSAWVLDAVAPFRGQLHKEIIRRIPPDAFLLQGEISMGSRKPETTPTISQTSVLMILNEEDELPVNARLAMNLYQIIMLVEGGIFGDRCDDFNRNRALLREKSLYLFHQQSEKFKVSLRRLDKSALKFDLFQCVPAEPANPSVKQRHLQHYCALSWSLSRNQSLKIHDRYAEDLLNSSLPIIPSRPGSASRSGPAIGIKLDHVQDSILDKKTPDETTNRFFLELERALYRYSALNWFSEQAENESLMCCRGLRAVPMFQELGLFDDKGQPMERQFRENWSKLQDKLDDDDGMIKFFFPEKSLSETELCNLKNHIGLIRSQPWSPHAALKAVLADWPEEDAERKYSFDEAENQLSYACDRFMEGR